MPKKLKVRDTTATYCRSYLVTFGLLFVALSILIWRRDGAQIALWPWWGFVLLAVFLLGGIALALFGLFGPSSKMESWADAASTHEASLIIMVLAYPVYLVLAPFYERR
jgi:cytochrome bd-type quinol oxidase subunit 2